MYTRFTKEKSTPELTKEIRLWVEQAPWYRKKFRSWFPIIFREKHLRLFVFQFGDHSTSANPITKKHLFDLLQFNHRSKWWHPKYIGFQIWY